MRTLLRSLCVAAATVFCATSARADGTLVDRPLGSTTAPFGFVEYLPPDYSACATERHPLVIALTGLGELGDGTSRLHVVREMGIGARIRDGETYFAERGAIVLIPQAPDQWQFGMQLTNLDAFFDYALATYRVDPGRVYFTGLSAGGGGVYVFVASDLARGRVTAIVPICGNSNPFGTGAQYTGIPMWSFQSWGDGVNPRSRPIGWSNRAGDAIAGRDVPDVMTGYPHAGGDTSRPAATTQTARFDSAAFAWSADIDSSGASRLRLTLFPDDNHDAWSRAYANRGMWDWVFAQRSARADPGTSCAMPGDGGVGTDAGPPPRDASVLTDTGIGTDGAASTDASIAMDSSASTDASRNDVAPNDVGRSADSGGRDGSADAGPERTGGGCGCAVPGGRTRHGHAVTALIALALAATRASAARARGRSALRA